MRNGLKRVVSITLRTVAGALVLVMVLASGKALFSGTSAEASAERYYPAFCLGGWQKARLAAGFPQVPEGASAGAFTQDNSAFLSPEVSAQIFCGYFPVERTERPPLSARAHFVWSFTELPRTATSAAEPAGEVSTGETGNPTGGSASVEPTVESIEETSTPTPTASEAPAVGEVPTTVEVTPTPTIETAPAPAETPAPAPTPSEPTSFIKRSTESLATFFAPVVVHAAEVSDAPAIETVSLSDLLEVRYSTDGVVWQSAGRVSRDNWYNYSVELPVHSWDDMENLQVMLVALPSLEERPAIYLESVGLSIEVSRTMGEVVDDGMERVAEITEAIIDAPQQLAGVLASLFTGKEKQLQEAPIDGEYTSQPTVKRIAFSIPGATRVALALPQGVSNLLLSDNMTNLPAPEVSVTNGGAGLTVTGVCRKPYFVVLTFRNERDYAENPRSFVANYAGTCVDSRFVYDVTNIPVDTQPGTYYLVMGEQEGEGSWTPVSSPIPVDISTVLE